MKAEIKSIIYRLFRKDAETGRNLLPILAVAAAYIAIQIIRVIIH